jgi:hypothetical protein
MDSLQCPFFKGEWTGTIFRVSSELRAFAAKEVNYVRDNVVRNYDTTRSGSAPQQMRSLVINESDVKKLVGEIDESKLPFIINVYNIDESMARCLHPSTLW